MHLLLAAFFIYMCIYMLQVQSASLCNNEWNVEATEMNHVVYFTKRPVSIYSKNNKSKIFRNIFCQLDFSPISLIYDFGKTKIGLWSAHWQARDNLTCVLLITRLLR